MDSETINISGIDKAEVLACLYNNSKQIGLGFLHKRGQFEITRDEAAELLSRQSYFDYLHGRIMKVDMSREMLDPRLYDRDNGAGAAAKAIGTIKSK